MKTESAIALVNEAIYALNRIGTHNPHAIVLWCRTCSAILHELKARDFDRNPDWSETFYLLQNELFSNLKLLPAKVVMLPLSQHEKRKSWREVTHA
jgi:hypothetical protein